MEKLIILILLTLSMTGAANAKVITLNIPDRDISIVENDVVDAEQWIREAWANKLIRCKQRLAEAEIVRSRKESQPIPAGDDAIIQKAFDRPDYKSRKEREAEREAEILAGR